MPMQKNWECFGTKLNSLIESYEKLCQVVIKNMQEKKAPSLQTHLTRGKKPDRHNGEIEGQFKNLLQGPYTHTPKKKLWRSEVKPKRGIFYILTVEKHAWKNHHKLKPNLAETEINTGL